MTLPRTVVFDLDGTLVDTAPDLIAALNYVLDREGVPPVPMKSARNMIGAGARKLIERGLELEGRAMSVEDDNRLMKDFIDYYAAHIADASRPFEGLEAALDQLAGAGADHVARRFKRHRRQAFTAEHEIERGDQVGRGVDQGAVEVEDDGAGKGHGNSLAAGKASCK
jgi:phosphoglycolate phosphatase-like HAD superfamily hydrolase